MPYYVVIARDPLISSEAVASLLPPSVVSERHFVTDLTLKAIFDMLGTADLFASERAYHYEGFMAMKPGAKDGKRLAEILSRIPKETTLVCSQVFSYATRGEENRALKSKAYKLWTKDAMLTDVLKLSEGSDAADWISERAHRCYNLNLTYAQVERVLAAAAGSPALADCELRKLWMLMPDDKPRTISDKTIAAVLSVSPGARFYDIADAIMDGAQDWRERLLKWFELEPKPERMVSELKRRLLGLLALSRGEQVMPPFFAKQLRGFAHHWHGDILNTAILELATLEHKLKSGGTTGETSLAGRLSALELYIAGLGTLR